MSVKNLLTLCTIFIFATLVSPPTILSQELEPRSLTNLPVGTNFVVVGYGFAQGNILLDPAVPIEDLDAKLNTVVAAYVRSINVLGLGGKVDVVIPWASGDWDGYYNSIDTSRSVNGFGDARLRLSVNFIGSPALDREGFASYKPRNISGLSLQLIVPSGQYNPDKLINLGSNRWVFKPQWGFSHYFKSWIFETYLSAWFFTKNTSFFSGNELSQKPLGAIKLHVIRSFPKRWWLAVDAGYALGGRTYINAEETDTRISTFRFGVTLAVPIAQHHNIRFTGVTGIRLEKGSDFDAVGITYQYRWLKKKKGKNR